MTVRPSCFQPEEMKTQTANPSTTSATADSDRDDPFVASYGWGSMNFQGRSSAATRLPKIQPNTGNCNLSQLLPRRDMGQAGMGGSRTCFLSR